MNTTNNDSLDSSETIFPADPRITAYAFGELEGDELTRVETAVNADPALQAAVAELRGFGGQLTTALGDEKTNSEVVSSPIIIATKKRRGLRIPFPLHYLATAAAACFAVVVWVRHEPAGPRSEPVAMREQIALSKQIEPIAVTAMPVTAPSVVFNKTLSAEKPMAAMELKKDQGFVNATVVSPLEPAFAIRSAETHRAVAPTGEVIGQVGMNTGMIMAAPSGKSQSLDSRRGSASRAPASAPAAAMLGGNADYVDGTLAAPAVPMLKPRASLADGSRVDRDQERTNEGADAYAHPGDNGYRTVASEPLSTFSVDIDTASYANVRRYLVRGSLPPRDAVRIEELINYFPYRYTPPVIPRLGVGFAGKVVPFAAKLEVASAPWAPAHRLVRIGIKGAELTAATRPPANLVFLLDVSGSMNAPNRLPLVKESLRLLVGRLRADDRVAIVTYAGSSGLALPSTPASRKTEILAALNSLRPGGSTNGAMGIHLAYDIAKANFIGDGGINRVILCTDGDFNVGVTNRDELVRLIEEKAKSRVFLSVFGFGMGNLKDNTLESLADKGNGAYGYIDTRREAEKVFVEQAEGTLATIAKDVKIQVEFNPARVASYRLIGYENRLLAKEDFNNDAVDAGDIGAGHTVMALYEIVPAGTDADGGAAERPAVDALKYQGVKPRKDDTEVVPPPATRADATSKELLTVKIRYKAPEGDVSKKQEFSLIDTGAEFAKADGEFQFAAAVAAWGMLLRDSPDKGTATFEQVLGWAENGLGDDEAGYRAEFLQLVRRSAELANR